MFYKLFFKGLWNFLIVISTVFSMFILVGVTDDEIAEWQLLLKYWWIFVLLFIITEFIVGYIYVNDGKTKKNASVNVHNFAHNLRNSVLENTTSKMLCNSTEFKDKCSDLCDDISGFIENEYNLANTVSMKLLKPWDTKQDENDILNTEVYTLCVSGLDYHANETNLKSKVSDYTAFEDILLRRKDNEDKEKTTFACSNLTMLKIIWKMLGKERYRGCSQDCKSAIMVPIRVNLEFAEISNKDECYKDYKTFGFICIECKKTCSEFTKKKMADFVCAFADYLCVYFFYAYDVGFYDEYAKKISETN